MIIKNWKLNFLAWKGIETTAPCSMYSVLTDNKLIDDPYFRVNAREAMKLSEHDCEFYADIDVDSNLLKYKSAILKLNGIDTLCDVFINGCHVAKTENMHRTYKISCKEFLKEGKNTINLYFSSPAQYMKDKQSKHPLFTNGDSIEGISHMRKAYFSSGWDWAPMLLDMGIFKDVELIGTDEIYPEDFYISQVHKDGKVYLSVKLEGGEEDKYTAMLEVKDADDEYNVSVAKGNASLTIDNPKLWWPNGYGDQHLYDVTVQIYDTAGNVASELKKTIGLRTLTLSREKDKYGEEFCFLVNGHKIFAKGANYVPQDSILSYVTPERTEKFVKSCADANFNCLRVWGGGYYPEDFFFDYCDKYGILIWQDFMIACADIHLSKNFTENIVPELIENVKRIRHRASLALLCGNNEMELMIFNRDEANMLIKHEYLELYERIMPDICEEYAPDVYYWPSSPSSCGGFDDPNDENRGDCHSHEDWWFFRPYQNLGKRYFRFLSEYGAISYPSEKTINTYADEADKYPASDVMDYHQKCLYGTHRTLFQMNNNYPYPYSFNNFAYVTQILQGDTIAYVTEHNRRNRGRCMGALYWMVNDCWPCASFSTIDYYGRWKASHYATKRSFAPVLLSVREEDGALVLNVSSESMKDFCGKIEYFVADNKFNKYYEALADIKVKALSSLNCITVDVSEHVKGYEKERFFGFRLLDEQNNVVSENSYLFVKPNYYEYAKPEIKTDITKNNDIVTIKLKSNVFAQKVGLDFSKTDIILNDNYVDIISDREFVLTGTTDALAEDLISQLEIMTVNELVF